MPELPEVETTRRGVAPYLEGQTVRTLVVRQPRLRWPVPPGLAGLLAGQPVRGVSRRGKYLLIDFDAGTVLIHLGMSGSLRLVPGEQAPGKQALIRRTGASKWSPMSQPNWSSTPVRSPEP